MGKKSYVRDSKENVTAIREVSNDKRHSYLYKADNSVSGLLIHGGKGALTEVAEHRGGKTKAYEADTSFIGLLFYDGKGKPKE